MVKTLYVHKKKKTAIIDITGNKNFLSSIYCDNIEDVGQAYYIYNDYSIIAVLEKSDFKIEYI